MGAGPRTEGRRRRDQPSGHRSRRRRGRLRAGALRRCRGAGRRRRACRLEGRVHRHSGIDASQRWRGSARTRGEIVAVLGPTISARRLRGRAGIRRRASSTAEPRTRASSRPRRATAIRCSTFPPISSRGSKRRASARAASVGLLHLCRRGALLFLSPRHASRRAGLRPAALRDRAERRLSPSSAGLRRFSLCERSGRPPVVKLLCRC